MKTLPLPLTCSLVISLTSCSNKENFDWILGEWKRTNEKIGHNTYEKWTKISATEYRSFGFTLSGLDTI